MATIERYDMSDAGATDDGPDADLAPMTEAEEAAIRADLDAERAGLAEWADREQEAWAAFCRAHPPLPFDPDDLPF